MSVVFCYHGAFMHLDVAIERTLAADLDLSVYFIHMQYVPLGLVAKQK